ncbi:MAG: hypothetical protein PVF40_05745 [Ectothiorhodospiraceae bacterium]|jgi:hypothetical protein
MKAQWIIGLITALFMGGAIAAGMADMSSLDANGDGMISAEEAQANADLSSQFDSLDSNGDGQLEEAEFAQFETMQKSE